MSYSEVDSDPENDFSGREISISKQDATTTMRGRQLTLGRGNVTTTSRGRVRIRGGRGVQSLSRGSRAQLVEVPFVLMDNQLIKVTTVMQTLLVYLQYQIKKVQMQKNPILLMMLPLRRRKGMTGRKITQVCTILCSMKNQT